MHISAQRVQKARERKAEFAVHPGQPHIDAATMAEFGNPQLRAMIFRLADLAWAV
jgi:hypothetical protein